MEIRPGCAGEEAVFADMFRRMWRDNGVPAEAIVDDWEGRILDFLRETEGVRFFLAVDGEPVGGAACQRFAGLYPDVLEPAHRRYGYIWGVYVAASHRRRGLGRRLTEQCVESLRSDGCTHALLHTAPPGRGIYQRMGFSYSNEMRLALK